MILKRIRKRYSDNKNNKFLIQKDDFRIALFWLQLYVYMFIVYYIFIEFLTIRKDLNIRL